MLETEQIFSTEFKNDSNSLDKISHLFTEHYTSFSATPSIVSVIFSEEIFRNEPILIKKISEVMNNNNQILFSIIKDGQKNNEIRDDIDIQHIVVIIMGSLRVFVKKWQQSNYSFNLVKEGPKLVNSIKIIISK